MKIAPLFAIPLLGLGFCTLAAAGAPSARLDARYLNVFGEGVYQEAPAPAQATPKPHSKGEDIVLPDGPGEVTTRKLCSNCHSVAVWAQQRHTKEKWSSIIDNMLSKGMEASDDDLAITTDYLGTYLAPPIQVTVPPPAK